MEGQQHAVPAGVHVGLQVAVAEGYRLFDTKEAMKVVLDAIQRAGRKDRGAVRDALFATQNFQGALGTWSLLDTGDTSLTNMSGREVKGGKFDDENAITLEAPR